MARGGRPRKAGERYPDGSLKKKPVKRDGWYVYVMMSRAAFIKIGMSSRPAGRAADIKASEGIDVSVVWMAKCESKDEARRLETAVHRTLKGYREHVAGEWYNLGLDHAVSAIKQEAGRVGVAIDYGAEHEMPRASTHDLARVKFTRANGLF